MEIALAALPFVTLGLVGVFAFLSARASRIRLEDENAPKSTLAADMPNTVPGKPADT